MKSTTYAHNDTALYFQLPDPRMFAFDPQTRNWSSQSLPKGIGRFFGAGYTQSARNKIGYTLGGTLVTQSGESMTGEFSFNK